MADTPPTPPTTPTIPTKIVGDDQIDNIIKLNEALSKSSDTTKYLTKNAEELKAAMALIQYAPPNAKEADDFFKGFNAGLSDSSLGVGSIAKQFDLLKAKI